MPILISFDYNHSFSSKKKKKIDNFIEFCIDRLLPKQKASKQNYYIHFEFHAKMKLKGETEVESDTSQKGRYKEYIVTIKKDKDFAEILQTIAHELVHVKQYAEGTLNFGKDLNHSIWKGKVYDEKKISYWELPWEIEAYGMERCLYELWFEERKR